MCLPCCREVALGSALPIPGLLSRPCLYTLAAPSRPRPPTNPPPHTQCASDPPITALHRRLSHPRSSPLLQTSNNVERKHVRSPTEHRLAATARWTHVVRPIMRGPVAQWMRHRLTEPRIAGSSPAGVVSSFGERNAARTRRAWPPDRLFNDACRVHKRPGAAESGGVLSVLRARWRNSATGTRCARK